MEISFTPNDRGQVGIGTLIVFIAMVLVAAIAAGVLINTAGFLQTQAEDTGTESTEQVANNLNIITEVGEVNDTGSGQGTISGLEVGLQPAAGSDDLNLEELSIQYVADESFSNLVHVKDVSTDQDNSIVGEDTVFNTEPVTAEDGEDNVMTDNADRYDLVIPLEDERPFVNVEELEVDGDGEISDRKVDIVITEGEGNIENKGQLADTLGDDFETDDLTEIEVVEDDPTNIDAALFEADDDFSFDFTEDPSQLQDDSSDSLPSDSDDMERYVAYVDEVNAEQLNGFDDSEETLAPAFFDGLSNDNLSELVEGEEAELTFTTETGAQTVAILQVPDSLAGEDDGDAVDL